MEEDPISFWQHVHGATTHFPIALAIVSLAFDIAGALFKKPHWRTVGLWILVAAAVSAVPAVGSGLYYVYVDPKGKETLANEGMNVKTMLLHRNLGLYGGGGLILLTFWRGLMKDKMSTAVFAIYLLVMLATVVAIGWTGYKGAYVRMGY